MTGALEKGQAKRRRHAYPGRKMAPLPHARQGREGRTIGGLLTTGQRVEVNAPPAPVSPEDIEGPWRRACDAV
jgi:hypothetical protein